MTTKDLLYTYVEAFSSYIIVCDEMMQITLQGDLPSTEHTTLSASLQVEMDIYLKMMSDHDLYISSEKLGLENVSLKEPKYYNLVKSWHKNTIVTWHPVMMSDTDFHELVQTKISDLLMASQNRR